MGIQDLAAIVVAACSLIALIHKLTSPPAGKNETFPKIVWATIFATAMGISFYFIQLFLSGQGSPSRGEIWMLLVWTFNGIMATNALILLMARWRR